MPPQLVAKDHISEEGAAMEESAKEVDGGVGIKPMGMQVKATKNGLHVYETGHPMFLHFNGEKLVSSVQMPPVVKEALDDKSLSSTSAQLSEAAGVPVPASRRKSNAEIEGKNAAKEAKATRLNGGDDQSCYNQKMEKEGMLLLSAKKKTLGFFCLFLKSVYI